MTEKMYTNRALSRTTLTAALLFAAVIAPQADEPATTERNGTDDAQEGSVAMKRDPFWPVGYAPKWIVKKESPTEQAVEVSLDEIDWNRARGEISIQGVSSRAGNEFYAIINGEVKGAGETVTVAVGEVNYTWMIEGISPPHSVQLRRVKAE